MEVIQLLKKDHQLLRSLFTKFERSTRDGAARKEIVEQIIRELSMHAGVEEQLVYPLIRREVPQLESKVFLALEQHHAAKVLMAEIQKLGPEHDRYIPKVMVLKQAIDDHIEMEEAILFERLQRAVNRENLETIGERVEEAKRLAPTRPHPRAPDTPPGNLMTGPLAKMMDMGRDFLREAARPVRKTTRPRAAAKRSKARR